jgi:hypothetical protein
MSGATGVESTTRGHLFRARSGDTRTPTVAASCDVTLERTEQDVQPATSLRKSAESTESNPWRLSQGQAGSTIS